MSSSGFQGLLGYDLPLSHSPRNAFPTALIGNGDFGRLDTYREVLMRQVMNSIIDKPEWYRKVYDEQITAKWRQEVADSGKDISLKMMDWIIQELRWKADYLDKHGAILAFDTGIVISDTAISPDLQQELQDAVKALETNTKKDFHPGSDDKVVDLVHPSLFPVIYGRSRILTDRLINLDDCLNHVGEGELLPTPTEQQIPTHHYSHPDPFSRKFQWMPCNIKLTGDGGCRVTSYINNLHPKKNSSLYRVIEKIVAQTIPLWNITLSNLDNNKHRIAGEVVYEPESPGSASWSDWEANREMVQPEPGEFEPEKVTPGNDVDLREDYPQGLQVIVKLANIELTPEKPVYHGGTWHVEGAQNEHICATSIYYYDSENITDSSLAFRQRVLHDDLMDELEYPQNEHEFLQVIYGLGEDVEGWNETRVTQDIGSISTRERRLLTFPNVLQHRVSPFGLADTSKSGHRKILALFLVDPNYQIISSANVPPQSEEWWEEKREAIFDVLPTRLPRELQDMVMQNMDVGHITMKEACEYRLELMEERTAKTEVTNEAFEWGEFNLCEH
ncbi:hypothetical protein BJX66DRAFT_334091 [Aspergillus keveii]|uniref:Uncharacterized protein n=1 Tax=Aspergillus keveii TaxID=714993 RepID=A0ABR4GH54_9EURO